MDSRLRYRIGVTFIPACLTPFFILTFPADDSPNLLGQSGMPAEARSQ